MNTTPLQDIIAYRVANADSRIGVVASCFDLLHAGHVLMLQDAKRQCDKLVAFLQTDPTIDRPTKNKPILSFQERKILVEGCKYIDQVFTYTTEKELYDSLRAIRPDIRILGDDYINKPYTGDDLHIPMYFHRRSEHGWSTTALRKKIYELERIKWE